MAYKFNPFTDTLDLVGSSDSYIDGEVQYHSNLPVTLGSPAVNSAFLVRKGEGLYFISRKPAGIWVRELNNGNLDDWKYAGTFSDLYRDANFRIINDADVSKELAFSLSGITTGTTRTLTAPNKSGTIALTTDIPSVNVIELEADGTTTITTAQLPARGIAYADGASGSSSLLADFQVGGTSVLKIGPDGALQARTTQAVHVRIGSGFDGLGINGGLPCLRHGGIVTFRASSSGNYMNNVPLGWSSSLNGTSNVILVPEADATLAQRNTTNPQTFRIYTHLHRRRRLRASASCRWSEHSEHSRSAPRKER
jgi:hypothetical protein